MVLTVIGYLHNANIWVSDGFLHSPQDISLWKTELILAVSLAAPLACRTDALRQSVSRKTGNIAVSRRFNPARIGKGLDATLLRRKGWVGLDGVIRENKRLRHANGRKQAKQQAVEDGALPKWPGEVFFIDRPSLNAALKKPLAPG